MRISPAPMPEPILRNIRLLMPVCGPQVTSERAPRLASLSTKTGRSSASSRRWRMLMPTHSGRIAPCATVPVRRSMGPGIPTPAPTTALRSTPLSGQQPVQHADGGLDALLGVVAQGQQDRFLGDHVVAQRGQHDAQVPAAEVDPDGDGTVAVEPDVQGPPPGAGDRFGGGQPGVLHDLDDVRDRGRGEAGLPGQFRLRGGPGEKAFDDPLLVQMPEGGLRSGVFGSAPR